MLQMGLKDKVATVTGPARAVTASAMAGPPPYCSRGKESKSRCSMR